MAGCGVACVGSKNRHVVHNSMQLAVAATGCLASSDGNTAFGIIHWWHGLPSHAYLAPPCAASISCQLNRMWGGATTCGTMHFLP